MSLSPAPQRPQPHLRTLTADDLHATQRWVHSAGWNQTPSDWLRLLEYQPEGCFAAVLDGRPVGCVTTTCYGTELAWIGMMLVDPNYRRRGIAAALMRHSIDYLRRCGLRWIQLDATAQGRPLYEQLGFQPQWHFQRCQRNSDTRPDAGAPAQRLTQAAAGQASLDPAVLALDRTAFGADRTDWLRRLGEHSTVYAAADGLGMLRPGRLAAYLGPVTAADGTVAARIVERLVQQVPGPVIWDVPSPNRAAQQLAQSLGFQPVRSLLRMALGQPQWPPCLAFQFALADPATG